ncbi:MAG TPA: type I phosphomannose isomerase catalytic subunit [Verrucomicrobiae bacterium]|jgi:mannose-6-phosphate isomerase|nr:type I phosphomannose isomerase catalytic subunit [Verrucomicrobiae bacterium]
MLYPLTFKSIFKERIWGGRALEKLYRKSLPPKVPIGESWEISDRPGDASVITNGPLAGKDLRWLMEHHERELLGEAKSANGRFPLLIKILDAQEKLSLQVHPPAQKADELHGEPKTEAWYIADAAPGAELYVGLKRGVTRGEFEQKIKTGDVAECFHRVPVRAGDTMFLPSGRVHAIGAGLVIFEIQQNSDTTYRVFDWNRVGLDKKPRELHIAESLASIDFEDFEPGLVSGSLVLRGGLEYRTLVSEPLFGIEEFRSSSGGTCAIESGRPRVVAVVDGKVHVEGTSVQVSLMPGEFALIPAGVSGASLRAERDSIFLVATAGSV